MLREMVYKMFINTTTIISFVYFGSQTVRNLNIKSPKELPLNFKIFYGIFGGLLGCLLMIFHFNVGNDTIFDFRFVAQIILCTYLGFAAGLIQGVIMITFRLFLFGINSASVIGSIMIGGMTICIYFISKLKISTIKKWIYAFVLCGAIISIRMFSVTKNFEEFINMALLFWILCSVIAVISYRLVDNVWKANEMYLQLKEESTKDHLTGLNNIRNFDKVFDAVIGKAKENGQMVSILVIDIDFFKKVNDTYGHAAGDAVLTQLGEVLLRTCRGVDFVARVGGEEFAIILSNCDGNEAVDIGERVRKGVESQLFLLPNGKQINITVSIGACCYPESVEDILDIKKQADDALYRAKHEGRNRVCLYNSNN